MSNTSVKQCTKCGTEKPLEEFKLQKRKSGWFPTSQCRFCLNEASRLFMRKHLEKPEVREASRERDRNRYHEVIKKDPVKIEAERIRKREYMSRPEVRERKKDYLVEYLSRPGKREEVARKSREWVEANRDRARKYWRDYYQTEAGRIRHRLQESKRRALIRGVRCDLTREDWDRIREEWGGRCAYCSSSMDLTMDHMIPITRGGDHTASNIVPACLSCNSRKGKKTVEEFLFGTKAEDAA